MTGSDTVVTGVNEIIEESQVKDEVSIESEKNESLDGSNIEIVEEIADNIPSPVIAEGEVAVEMKVDRGTENVVSRNDTEVTTSEQNQIEVTETKEILNQTSYQTESGEQRQIIWAHGITPPAMEQSGGFVKEKYGDYLNYTAPFEAGKGYYDTNKSLNASFIDLNLCFAAVSSNMVHRWLEQNSSYVERYLKEKKGTVNVEENYAITDLRRYINSFQNQQNSRVFDMFKTYYGYRTNGFVSDALVDLFINGYKPKAQGGVNLEDSQLVPDSRGGFFYDVFKEKKLTNRIFSGSYERFGEDVRTVLESKGLLGLTYRTLGYATHIVTVWGAEYDNQGKIKAVYITDSDDQQEQIGLKRMGITRDASGNPRLNNHMKNNSAGALLDYVHAIRLGQDLWEEYFNLEACITGDALVALPEGESVRIADIVPGARPNSDNAIDLKVLDRHGNPVLADRLFHSGEHPVYTVRTVEGLRVTGTANHPLLCLVDVAGVPTLLWKLIDEIKPGDYAVIQRSAFSVDCAGFARGKPEFAPTTYTVGVPGLVRFLEAHHRDPDAQAIADELTDGRFYYAKVASVTDAGVQPVYSLRVDTADHAFITNGFVSHATGGTHHHHHHHGLKTRNKKAKSDKLIVRRRNQKPGGLKTRNKKAKSDKLIVRRRNQK